jgi:multidrug efflux system outer membrane protein
MGKLAYLSLITVFGVAGCSFAPRPEPVAPVAELPEAFSGAQGPYDAVRWWGAYGDPVLDRLVDSTLVANLDLAEAVGRVEEFRALVGIATADLLPGVTGSATASRQDSPVNAGFGAIIGAILGSESAGDTTETSDPSGGRSGADRANSNSYDLSLGLIYEMDFWGRARSDRKAALADLTASASDYQVVQLGVLAETIGAYFDLRDLQNRLRITEEVVDVLTEREALSVTRYNRGLISSFELYSVRQDRQAAEAQLPQLRSQVGEVRRRLALVTGRHLGELELLLGEPLADAALPLLQDPVPMGIPADLLQQRPDVRASVSRLEAARLRVGARRAELLPQINLTGTLGLQSSSTSELFNLSQWFSNLAAGLTQPFFQGGRLRANLDAAEARYAQRLASHGRIVLTAMGEAETALLRHQEELGRYQTLTDQLAEARASVDLQGERYRSGVGAYTDFLDALRVLLTTESTLSGSARDVALARLGLHRALGGSWAELPGESTTSTPNNQTNG